MARSTNKISLTVKKLLAAEPLRVYQSINGKKRFINTEDDILKHLNA